MDWIPTITDRTGPVYARILDALAEDIASGQLRRGQQLPTHRALAGALGVDLTTVTRAYSEARQRGLTEARVGQGTFVAATVAAPQRGRSPTAEIDLSMNMPPQPAAADLEGRIARGLAAIQAERGLAGYLGYRQPGGSDDERGAAAEWMQARLRGLRGDRVVIAPGTQTALLCMLLALTRPDDAILCESLTYPGFKAAAAQLGRRLVGIPMDAQGIVPEQLDQACRLHRPKAVYLVPTIHNPTAATMPPARRQRVAEIIRRHGLMLFEDDAYGPLDRTAVPLASLIPERTYLALSLSKCMAPGLRASFVVAPDRRGAAVLTGALRATVQIPVPLTVALVIRWLRDGSADAIVRAIRAEAGARQRLAAKVLHGYAFSAHPCGHHVWLPLPEGWGRAEFVADVQRQGLAVVASDAFAVTEAPPHALRVSLGAARDRSELSRALELLRGSLASPAPTTMIV